MFVCIHTHKFSSFEDFLFLCGNTCSVCVCLKGVLIPNYPTMSTAYTGTLAKEDLVSTFSNDISKFKKEKTKAEERNTCKGQSG